MAADELRELGASVESVSPGKVFFSSDTTFMYLGNYMLKTVNRLLILLCRARFSDLRELREIAASVSYSSFIRPGSTFAVRAERVGTHPFTSIDVGREVGAAIIESYLSERGVGLKVDLRNPDVEVYVCVTNDEIVIGINTSGPSLHRRLYRIYDHPAALKTTLAAALVRLTGYEDGPFLDPMCGGGTILAEAGHKALRIPTALFRQYFIYRKLAIYDKQEEMRVLERALGTIDIDRPCVLYGIDVSPKHVRGARVNLRSAELLWKSNLFVGDSTQTKTHRCVREDVRHIACNPPYGIRFHNPRKIPQFYLDMLRTLSSLYPGATLAVITAACNAMNRAVRASGVRTLKKFWVMHGGLRAKIYLLNL